MSQSPLETLASHLLAAGKPYAFVNTINRGLNGNRTLHLTVKAGVPVIGHRKRPDDQMVYDVEIDQKGALSREISDRALEQINKSISLIALSDAEAERELNENRTPVIEPLLYIHQVARKNLEGADKDRMNMLGLGNTLEVTARGLRVLTKVISPDALELAIKRYTYDGVRFAQNDGFFMTDRDGQELAHVSPDTYPSTRVSGHVAAAAFNEVLRAAVQDMDMKLDLVHRLKEHRKTEKERLKAEEKRRDEFGEQQKTARALAFLAGFQVPAGEIFLMRHSSYDEERGVFLDYDTVMRAEKDLDSMDYLQILNGNSEGLVKEFYPKVLRGDRMTREMLRNSLERVNEAVENALEEGAPGDLDRFDDLGEWS